MSQSTTIAVFVNDANHAQEVLRSLNEDHDAEQWVLVACPPMLSRHIGRWVSQSGRRHWVERWSLDLFSQLERQVKVESSAPIERVVAQKSLAHLSAQLQSRYGDVRLVDARRPHMGRAHEPLVAAAAPPRVQMARGWFPLFLTTGLGAMFALVD